MFLGSLETQRRALQDHAEKDHSKIWEDKSKYERKNLSIEKLETPYLLQMKSE